MHTTILIRVLCCDYGQVRFFRKPSGITIACQEARDLTTNRKLARKRLCEKLDFLINGDDSKISRKINKIKKL